MAKKKFFETDSFTKMKNEWYSKLEASGFEDVEKGEAETLVQPQVFSAGKGINYYQFCEAVLRDYNFKRDIDRAIFELHRDGKTEREIVAWLETKSYKPLKQKAVNLVINRVKEEYLRMKG